MPTDTTYYYGTRDRLDSPTHVHNIYVATSNGILGLAQFSEASEALRYNLLLQHIRHQIADINDQQARGYITEQFRCEQLRTLWIPMTELFTEELGPEMVPKDIRNAIDAVRHGVGLPAVTWPNIPTIDKVNGRWVFTSS